MLNGSLYTFLQQQEEAGIMTVKIKVNLLHAVFAGHFPGRPVVPGACLLQMVKEVMEVQFGQPLRLTKADFLKFILPVVPAEGQLLDLHLKYSIQEVSTLKVSATLSLQTTPYFKFQGYFSIDTKLV